MVVFRLLFHVKQVWRPEWMLVESWHNPLPRHCERSEAIQNASLDCFVASTPRNDGKQALFHVKQVTVGSAKGNRSSVKRAQRGCLRRGNPLDASVPRPGPCSLDGAKRNPGWSLLNRLCPWISLRSIRA